MLMVVYPIVLEWPPPSFGMAKTEKNKTTPSGTSPDARAAPGHEWHSTNRELGLDEKTVLQWKKPQKCLENLPKV